MTVKLTPAQKKAAIAALPGWAKVKGRDAIEKTYRFKDFNEAFGWMTRIALLAEKLDHHPEWANIYRTVDVTLTTHDAGGLTDKDISLAKAMDRLAGKAGKT